ncbi:hypothetical protein CJNNKLLH_3342 [Methylorubrum thiocyanatum]|nr:hypothetical protein CJNNKLLH_3342 [Methylorubrum thiocyanatum]
MPSTILTSVILSPGYSADVVAGSPNARAEAIRLTAAGILVFLTADDAATAGAGLRWLRDPTEPDGRDGALLRLVTPGAYHWPDGEVRMPLDAALDDGGLAAVRTIVEEVLSRAPADGAGRVEDGAGFVSVSTVGPLTPDLVRDIWTRCGEDDIALGMEGLDLEANPSSAASGRQVTVIAPELPSTAWYTAVTRAERIDPRSLLLVMRTDETERASLRAFRARLAADRRRLGADGPSPECIVDTSTPGTGIDAPEGHVLAPRIAVPSAVHFIQRWSESNRRYVREHYWRATEAARTNRNRASGLLVGLDAVRYARARDLVRLASLEGGDRVFDDYSGAVCFDPGFYEFAVPLTTGDRAVDGLVDELRRYFDDKLNEMPFDRPLLRRRLFTNSLVLLRGDAYYANLKQVPPWERADDYKEEAKALDVLFRRLRSQGTFNAAVAACLGRGDATRSGWKLLLGAVDQARNLGLILLSIASHRWRDSHRQTDDRDLLSAATDLVRIYYRVMLGDASLTGADLAQSVIAGAGRAVSELSALREDEEARARGSDWYDPDRPIRSWREADDPYENLLLGLLAVEGLDREANAVALGMFWGGVELPIVADVAAGLLGRGLNCWGFLSHGRYSSAAMQEGNHFCDLSTSGWRDIAALCEGGTSKVLLLDDNALSGGTLESARDLLLGHGLANVETWVVRFSGERREGQMRMDKGGTVEPAYMDKRLKGFLGETPYARSYSRKRYESPVGIFNTARSRILRYLHNNSFASKFEREGF